MNLLSVELAAELILDNNIVAVPTETVYGLFGLAQSIKAVNQVYLIKNRPADNPLICHFYSLDQMLEYVKKPPQYIMELILLIGPGPLTYICELKPNSPLFPACGGLNTICCRIPKNKLCINLLKKINKPLFGPSANTSGKVSGVTPLMIDQDLGDKIAGIVDGGQSNIGLESTIIDTLELNKIKILRPGAIGKYEINTHLSKLGFKNIEVLENQKLLSTTPGSKYRHYSPNCNIYSKLAVSLNSNTIIGLKEFQTKGYNFISFGSCDDLENVCANFYYNLYLLDQLKIESCIFDTKSYQFINNSNLSIAKALLNRLDKIIID